MVVNRNTTPRDQTPRVLAPNAKSVAQVGKNADLCLVYPCLRPLEPEEYHSDTLQHFLRAAPR